MVSGDAFTTGIYVQFCVGGKGVYLKVGAIVGSTRAPFIPGSPRFPYPCCYGFQSWVLALRG